MLKILKVKNVNGSSTLDMKHLVSSLTMNSTTLWHRTMSPCHTFAYFIPRGYFGTYESLKHSYYVVIGGAGSAVCELTN